MGTMELFLCLFVARFIAVQSVILEQEAVFPQDFPGFFENLIRFPFKRHFDFPPYDTIFSSWRTPTTPDFHMLGELPDIMDIPEVQVFCDESKLTVLVEKRSSSDVLAGEEMWLGAGCHSNGELPNRFVFSYSLEECGTTHVVQNGFEMFTNSLHVNPKKLPRAWWQTPSTVHISCIPKRSYAEPDLFVSPAPPEVDKMASFNIKAVTPSWTATAESNTYKRGQVVNLQVSANTRPEQQLFIQSCFVSASPEPLTRPRHAVIMNKGCTVPLGSPNPVVRFLASNRTDVVNFVLNTSYIISEVYIHCSVLVSDRGVTSGSKSCNYDVIQSRWEDVSGTTEVCDCCSSKCKGLSVKYLPEEAKAVISAGPLIIVDRDVEKSPDPSVSEPQVASSNPPVTDSMQSDGAATEDAIVSGSSLSRSGFSSPPQGVVVVSRDPVATLTLWLPGQVQDPEHGPESDDNLTVQLEASETVSNDLPEQQPSPTDQQAPLNTPTNEIGILNVHPLADWMTPPRLEKMEIAEDSPIRVRLARFSSSPQDEMIVNVQNQDGFIQTEEELADAAATQRLGADDAGPVIHSRLEFSKGADGSQALSYEEDVLKQNEGLISGCGLERKRERRQGGLRSTFLDLLRRLDRAE